MEPAGKAVQKEAADELRRAQGHDLLGDEAVPQCVRADPLVGPCRFGGFLRCPVQLEVRDRIGLTAAREQAAPGQHHAPALAFAPPHPQHFEQLRCLAALVN